MGWLDSCARAVVLATVLSPLYFATGGNSKKPAEERYVLPAEISVVDTTLPYETKVSKIVKIDSRGNKSEKIKLEKIVKTSKIDFSSNFIIKTDRYKLVKDEDWLPSRLVGHVLSTPGKLLFWDHNYGWGQDKERTKAILGMLEKDQNIKDLTIRLNHNEAFYDFYRMFTEKKLRERNNIIARATLGTLTTLLNEVWAEFFRGSYYNPLTQTIVCYTNIESITAHEIGHHKDFQRFSSDWWYALARGDPAIMLYQEAKASLNAKELLSEEDQNQFYRYLLPAFSTYLMASWMISRKLVQKEKWKHDGHNRDINKMDEEKKPFVYPHETLRRLISLNTCLYGGIAGYNALASNYEILNAGAFVGASIIAGVATNSILKTILPYEWEKD